MPSPRQRKVAPGKPASPADTLQQEVIGAMPPAIDKAIENYRTIAMGDAPLDPKEFQQHQNACKAALQHIEALLKLAATIDAGTGAESIGPDFAAADGLIRRAESAYKAFKEEST